MNIFAKKRIEGSINSMLYRDLDNTRLIRKSIGKFVKNYRSKIGFSVYEFAYFCGVTPQTIYNTEKGISISDKVLSFILSDIESLVKVRDVESLVEIFDYVSTEE